MSIFSLFSHNLVKEKYIFFDFETTGLYPLAGDRVVEIAMIKTVDGKIVDTLESMINPGISIPEAASKTNNITDDMVKDAPPFDFDFSKRVLEFIDDGILVAHNAAFDLGFLSVELARNEITYEGWRSIDTLKMAKSVFPDQKNKLGNLMRRYNIMPDGDLHRAIVDTEVLKKVYFELIDETQIRELAIDQIIKRYGFRGNFIHRSIPAKIRELIIEKKPIKGEYKRRDQKVVPIAAIPLAPVWAEGTWYLMAKTPKTADLMVLNCKSFVSID